MEGFAGTVSIPSEFPYGVGPERECPDPGAIPRCARCGSDNTSTYIKLMAVSGPGRALSGDLIIHPVHVVTCMRCHEVGYRNFHTLRDS